MRCVEARSRVIPWAGYSLSKLLDVDAAANQALLELLTETLDCARNRIELVRGHKSRHETIKLHGFTPEEVFRLLSRQTA